MDWVWDEYREKIGIGISGEEEQTEKHGDAVTGEDDLRMLCDHFHDDSYKPTGPHNQMGWPSRGEGFGLCIEHS